ncbi:MAG: DNA mismatch repair endonuclease MutL [Thermotogae bacterium]|nr:DNA mismatch repair endonuclease MutL [Thermotogota bacterium]
MNEKGGTRIFELPQDVIKKIAAGEVITGPQAVIKELVENALDANATEISIEIENGGKSYIKVSDNGMGMNEEEVQIAIKHHTTSKLRNVNDLERIYTYGFRGEALASIVQVSRTRIITRDEQSSMATILEVEGGEITNISKIGRKRGTTVEVRDIFFNLPARRRFLKSSNIEGRMVTDIIQKFALIQNNVKWNYVKDGRTVFNLPMANSMYERVQLLFPELKSEDLIEVKYEKEGIKIHGVISSPSLTFPSRVHQFVFVNGRYIRSGLVLAVMEKGYSEMLEKGRHPFISMNIELDPGEVDVNVHPQKLEVRFHREELILNLVKSAVRESLQHKMHMVIKPMPHTEKVEEGSSADGETEVKEQISTYGTISKPKKLFPAKKTDAVKPLESIVGGFESDPFKSLKPHLVVKNRYILCEYEDGIVIVDFHALHERILYEELLSRMEEYLKPQYLMMPRKLDLDVSTLELVEEIVQYLKEIGFNVRVGTNSVELLAIPKVLSSSDYISALLEILNEFKLLGILSKEEVYRKTFATIACHAAMKTGDKLTLEDAEYLINKMKEQKIKTCPHGRPLMYKLEFKQLDRFFHR